MTPSKTLFYLCIAFIVGIGLSSILKIPQMLVWGIFVLGILFIAMELFFKNNIMAIIGFCFLVLVLGMMRFEVSQFLAQSDALKKFNDRPDKITLIGFVSGEPDVRDTMQKLKITTLAVIVSGQKVSVKGDVLVTLGNYGDIYEYQYLDMVQVTGKLKTPAEFEDFSYKNYLAKDGIYSVMDYPKIELVFFKHPYNAFTYVYEKVLVVKKKLLQAIEHNFSPPESVILEGMVFGNDKNMSKELKDKFTITGLSHVTAVSGSNIVILINVIMIFLLLLGFWRGQAFYGSVAFIWLYIMLIGFPASGVRATIMGCVALLAQKLGRQNTSFRVIVLAGALMLLQNPLLLAYDVGFQLSFLASLGIIYLKPLIDIFLKLATKEHFKALCDLVSITLAAQIITLPVIVYNFGRLSLIAPVSNLLALPVVEALTIFGFLLAVCGALLPILGAIFMIPRWLLLVYFIKVLDIFSQPWAQATIEHISWMWVVAYYAILFLVIFWLQKRFSRYQFLEY